MTQNIEIPDNLFFEEGKTIEDILKVAVLSELKKHKGAGNSVANWEDGKVVLVNPDDIPVE